MKRKSYSTKLVLVFTVIIFITGVTIKIREKEKPTIRSEISLEDNNKTSIAINVETSAGSGNYEKKTVPLTGNYIINTDKSYCTIPGISGEQKNIPMEYKDGKVYIGLTNEGTKCNVWLDVEPNISPSDLLADIIKKNQGTPDFSKTSCSSGCDDTARGLFEAQDDFGTSYYYRGTVNYNWVKFGKVGNADIWWRIIRFNGNGSIRLIYAGTSTTSSAPAETGIGTQLDSIGTAFNSYDGAKSVKFMYDGADNIIKSKLDTWFSSTSNLNQSAQLNHIDTETGFCNDTGSSSSTSTQNYPPYNRLAKAKAPSLKCTSSNDLFTKSGNKGNNKLTYPVGLITADEISYAGGVQGKTNNGYYLYTGNYYWTMSPAFYSSSTSSAYVFSMFDKGWFNTSTVNYKHGVRPVINLKSNTMFRGDGTKEHPYEVVI